jgi:lipoprotein-anchoring transpeptidase ErfK/SrfK
VCTLSPTAKGSERPADVTVTGTVDRVFESGRVIESERKSMKRTILAGLAALAIGLTGCSVTSGGSSRSEPADSPVAAEHAGTSSAIKKPPAASVKSPAAKSSAVKSPAAKPKPAAINQCAGNTRAQFVLVSITRQHAGMCAYSRTVYDSPVTTGASASGDDTPTGTWRIQAKQGARYLTVRSGASYHVQYWMPYDGDYGFHDAAWQTFPEGSPLWHTQGSHGCVHLPITAMAWLYHWAAVGATVTVRA